MPRVFQGIIIVLGLIFCVNAFAQSTASPVGTVSTNANQRAGSALSASLSMGTESPLESNQFTGRALTNRYSASLAYELRSQDRLSLSSEFAHSVQPIEELAFEALSLGYRLKKSEIVNGVFAAPGLTLSLPVNEDSKNEESFRGAASASVIFSKKFNSTISMTYRPDIKVNNHQFTSTANDTFNTKASLSHGFGISHNVLESVSLSANATNYTLWNYNDRSRSQTLFSQELGISITDSISASIGHANFSSHLATNGKDANFDFFNQSSSVFYASLSLAN